jgi:hypothetical protein
MRKNRNRAAHTLLSIVVRAALGGVITVLVNACSGEAITAPSPISLVEAVSESHHPNETTTHRLSLVGADAVLQDGHWVRACEGISPARLSMFAIANVRVSRIGSSWHIIPATSSDGRFDMTLQRNDAPPLLYGGTPVVGTISGMVKNTFPPEHGRKDVRVVFGDEATQKELVGEIDGLDVTTAGVIRGTARFESVDGASITCAAGTVQWQLTGPLLN